MPDEFHYSTLKPDLGVQVHGADLSKPLTEAQIAELRSRFNDHHLLLFRNQSLSTDDHIRLVSHFAPPTSEREDGRLYSLVSNVHDDAGVPTDWPIPFHSDMEFSPHPYPVNALYGMEVEGGSPTLFVNLSTAYARLPTELKQAIADKHSLNVLNQSERYGNVRRTTLEIMGPNASFIDFPRTEWPSVRKHPVSGETMIYVSEMETAAIVELDPAASDELLQRLFTAMYVAENIYEHVWRAGDLVMWDNVGVQHGRRQTQAGRRRVLRRVVGSPMSSIEIFNECVAQGLRRMRA